MSVKRFYKKVNIDSAKRLSGEMNSQKTSLTQSKLSSFLPEFYAGNPSRIQRYSQYDEMDNDSEINMALNIIADFCTQLEEKNKNKTFDFEFYSDPTPEEVKILSLTLDQWMNLNDFDRRLWYIVRNFIKYGDQFFVRDPETFEWYWVDHTKVEKIMVDENKGKKPLEYIINDLSLNIQNKILTKQQSITQYSYGAGGPQNQTGMTNSNSPYNVPNNNAMRSFGVNAENVIHISLNVGLDSNWPFGTSILESIYKTFKQKELLEDAVLIYRIQRAPERRVFYIDTGNMPVHKAKEYVEQLKTEMWQKRIPNKTGSGGNIADAAYNPLCLALDTKIPLIDGRVLELSEIIDEYNSGKQNWVFSCNPENGNVVPGPITWAGVTRKNTEVLKLQFSNGKELILTPDHKIPVYGKGFVEAKDLSVYDNVITFKTRFVKKLYKQIRMQVYDNHLKRWRFVSSITKSFFSKNNQSVFKKICSFIKNKYKRHIAEKSIVENKIVSISKVNMKMDTGTITVDGSEAWHNFHTFATEAGIFVKNSINEDYYIPQTNEGRGSRIEILPGGQGLGDLDDLMYFNNKLRNGLQIPQSYFNNDNPATYNDGKVGTAYMQEFKFTRYCMRLQMIIQKVFDTEFKHYLKAKGIKIDNSIFDLTFNPPQNFVRYAQLERDLAQQNLFSNLINYPFMSKRFCMQRYLGMTEEEIDKNQKMWLEENQEKAKKELKTDIGNIEGMGDMSSLGIRPDFEDDFGGEDIDFGGEDIDFGGSEEPESPL